MLMTAVYFFLALLLLVTLHEAGHFFVARWCGVKVLRFSFGFGPVLFSWRDKHNTEFAFSLFPLGGYVKMLDEAHDEMLPEEKKTAFNTQSIGVRSAIILAGPVFNFLFAWIAFWLVSVIGMATLVPIVHEVRVGSIAEHAGLKPQDEFVVVDGVNVASWRDVRYALMPHMGATGHIDVEVISNKQNTMRQHLSLPLGAWSVPEPSVDPLEQLGITPLLPIIPPRVAEVFPDSPAEKAGLRVGDEVLKIDGHAITDWRELVIYVKNHPDQLITLVCKHGEQESYVAVQLGHQMNDKTLEGRLGVRSARGDWPKHMVRMRHEGPVDALITASKQTWLFTESTVVWMGRMLVGDLPLHNLSGPLGIAEGAGSSARGGLVYYLSFLALLSIGLGVLNLLPIPMLDGGQLMYCLVEWITGRPLSDRFKAAGISLGLFFLMTLTVVALKNDLIRLTGS
ncbi:MAG: RIP metalloprotease RseP [Legionellaceae bacterium]|nr:RIP metalloprotease RseP [Legionellaceae bacterium]